MKINKYKIIQKNDSKFTQLLLYCFFALLSGLLIKLHLTVKLHNILLRHLARNRKFIDGIFTYFNVTYIFYLTIL